MFSAVPMLAQPSAAPLASTVPPMQWPLLTGAFALALVFVTWWQQARYRQRIEKANEELRRSEDEARQAYAALRESESKFRLLFERSADAVLLIDPGKGPRFTDCNEAAARLLGYDRPEEVLCLEPGQVSAELQPDGSPSVPKAVEMIKLGIEKGSHRFEWINKRRDGTLITTEVVMTAVQLREQPLIVVVARDITARKRAEVALRESEEKFRLLFENTSDSIMFIDPETQQFIDCNDAALRVIQGGSREWFLSQPIHQISAEYQPDGVRSEEKLREIIRQALDRGPQRLEWLAKRFSGEEFMVDALVTSIRLRERTLLVAVTRDITEKKRAELTLRENQRLLTSILDNISEAVYRSCPQRGLLFANRAYLKMFGYESLTDLRSVIREELYADPADRARLLSLIEQQGGYTSQEVQYRRKDGTTFWGLASSIAVFEPGTERVDYHVGAITDITERKKAEDEIRVLNLDLERRIAERTAELRASEAQFRTMVEHAPEAIVVFDGTTGRFLAGNGNALRLFDVTREALAQLTPADVSPLLQPNGKTSAAMAAELIQRTCAGETPVFDWLHRSSKGRVFPSEVRLVRLPAEGRTLLRASILDTTERRRREQIQQATYQISEAIHVTEDLDNLYARIHGIIKGLMPAENFYLALRDHETSLYHYAYHVDQVDPRPAPRPMSGGLNGFVLRTGRALLTTKASMLDPVNEWHLAAGTPSAIWLGVPLVVRETIIGVMAVQDYENERAYGEDEKQILTFVAEQIALAIDRKRSEQALRESEAKHRALFEATSQGVLLHDENQFLEVNPAAVRILGFEPGQAQAIIGRHPVDFATPVQASGRTAAAEARLQIADCMATGSKRFEWLCRTPRGEDIPIEVLLTRIEMRGRFIIQAVINDISERKKAEAALRASEERFKLLFDMSPLGMAQVRWDGSFVQVNRAFADMIGYTVEEVERLTYWDVTPREYDAAEHAVLETLRARGHFGPHAKDYFHKQGHRVPVVLNGMFVRTADGEETLWGIVEDITNRKRAEAELLKALAREKELSALKSNFVSMVSHEFRTPLGVIMSSAEILRDYFEQLEPNERRDHLESIRKSTRRMSNLMEEVLLLSRVEAGKLNFEPSPLNLSMFSRRMVDEVLSATNRRCPIELSLACGKKEVLADDRLLRHVLTNLLTNAIKYSAEGALVEFSVAQEGDAAIFEVVDRGIGIPEADQPWLFNAFHRGRNVGQAPGTGLGLVIVKRCVDLHGGTITIESSVNSGTRARVSVPMCMASSGKR